MSKFIKNFKKSIIAGVIVLVHTISMITPITTSASTAVNGFKISGSKLYDANGTEFVMMVLV